MTYVSGYIRGKFRALSSIPFKLTEHTYYIQRGLVLEPNQGHVVAFDESAALELLVDDDLVDVDHLDRRSILVHQGQKSLQPCEYVLNL